MEWRIEQQEWKPAQQSRRTKRPGSKPEPSEPQPTDDGGTLSSDYLLFFKNRPNALARVLRMSTPARTRNSLPVPLAKPIYCHPERSICVAKRSRCEVEGPRVRSQHQECFQAFPPRTQTGNYAIAQSALESSRSGEKPTPLRRQPRSPAPAHQGRVGRPHLPRPALQQPPGLQRALRRKRRNPLQLPDHGLRGHLGVERGRPFQMQI